ncbi:uncharacterized protein PHACADRAFT_206173 [Phanerochaete carnosa HHB-10118-sp]|uniref:Uncharacterized protein n=1 Tax=Phanerochaete carnosa (strain HHB-10118-sp) TaxID=650164 RepID=K5W7N6_PHACS|nr:uncharacterized protein PHACADRAFT_206173 [Phanerochaete carnosa HHB-10118-sp]EKM59958.1 hypothetical protein PHACADRAFT_206173 [Phanerochaete carnosa HHB-10118-sp]
MSLVRILPACRHVGHNFHGDPGRILHSAALKSSLQSITSLELNNCSFPSLRILLRILGHITCLKDVTFAIVKWSDDQLTTADTASNVCTGGFDHIRSVMMRSCTNNTAVPAWILAAASTRHSFARRRTPGPAVPAETWAIIELIQTFLGGSVFSSEYHVKEAAADSLVLCPWNRQ